jgi:protocatechuate 3,4-dioxygenase beta subunit
LNGIDVTAGSSNNTPARRSSLEAPKASSPGAKVEGRVVNSVTGDPIPRARVSLEQENNSDDQGVEALDSITDSSGYFIFKNINSGNYFLSATRKGFTRDSSSLSIDGSSASVNVNLRLMANGVLAGKVLDSDGDPMANAIVMAVSVEFSGRHRDLAIARRVYSNDLGEYRLYDLRPGRYYVSAIGRDASTTSASDPSAESALAPIYYPNVWRLTDSTALNVPAGRLTSGIDLVVPKLSRVRLRGRILMPESKGNRTATVSLIPADLPSSAKYSRHTTDTQPGSGEFELGGVSPGAYILAANSVGEGKQYSGQQLISVGKTDQQGILLSLMPASSMHGMVQIEGEGSIEFSELQISLATRAQGSVSGHGTVNRNGSFLLENIRPDQYSVSILGLKHDWYLKAIYYRGKNVTSSGLDLTHGISGTLELVISPNGGGIDGTVLSEDRQKPAPASVALIPDPGLGEGLDLYRTVETDQAGRFSIRGVAPGRYTLVAGDDLDSIHELMARTGVHVQEVSVQENRTQSIKIIATQAQDF